MATHTLNQDCWLQILSEIAPNERTKYRSVCRQWSQLIDYLNFNQRCMEFCIESKSFKSNAVTKSIGGAAGSLTQHCQFAGAALTQSNNNNNSYCITATGKNNFHLKCQCISYDLFCKIFSNYPNLNRLSFTSFKQWNDHYLIRLAERCPKLKTIAFYSCHNLGKNYFNDFGFQNVTQIGWQRLVLSYGEQLTTLVMEDCDLENQHLSLIVQSFPNLKHLNIVNNSEITNYMPLCDLSPAIETLKIGPKLGKINRRSQSFYFNYEMPIDEIISGNGRNLRVLQLQGYLSSKLSLLCNLPNLEHLIINYITFSLVEEMFNQEIDNLMYSLKLFTNLKQLNLYQYNQVNTNDIQWLRQNRLSNLSNISRQSSKYSGQLNLEQFSLHSKDPLIAIEQFRLINFVLSSSPRLTTFALSSSKFDSSLHYNLNKSILVLLTKYGHRLAEIKLENMFSPDLYFYLVQTVLNCPSLTKFIIDDCDVETFLDCIDEQSELFESDQYNRTGPLTIKFLVSDPKLIDIYRDGIELNCPPAPAGVRIDFGLNRFGDASLCGSDDDDQDISQYPYNDDNDLTDLCQLIDSSFDLVSNVVDVIALCANYIGICVTYWMILKPSRFINCFKSLLRIEQ